MNTFTRIGLGLICLTVAAIGALITIAAAPRSDRDGPVLCAEKPMRPGEYCAPLDGSPRVTYHELREQQHGARPPDVPFLILGLVLVGSGLSGVVWVGLSQRALMR